MESKYGQMVRNTKDSGIMTKLTGMESSITLMVIFTRETGKMIKRMAKVNTFTPMEQLTMAIGKKTDNTVTELKLGLMEPSMKVIILRERNMERDC